jgi:hypothetical protein
MQYSMDSKGNLSLVKTPTVQAGAAALYAPLYKLYNDSGNMPSVADLKAMGMTPASFAANAAKYRT